MKIGTIDIGTNSMRLLTAQYKDGKIIDRKKYVNTTRIGQGVDSNGYISKEAIDRNIQALKEFKGICDEYKCDYICCMGTSALRDSKNSKEFVELAKKEANVDVEIIDEGSKGLFNLIGAKPAKVRVTKKPDSIDNAKKFLTDVLNSMNIKADINIKEENDVVNINLCGDKMGLVIGYRGETLDSLQYLVSLVINKNHENPYKRVVLDAENYRSKREETLVRVAQKAAYKVRKSKRPYKLEPMNPYERRIIHSALQEYNDINTYSEGEEPFRRIVISFKK